jgi:hypothetical protein
MNSIINFLEKIIKIKKNDLGIEKILKLLNIKRIENFHKKNFFENNYF